MRSKRTRRQPMKRRIKKLTNYKKRRRLLQSPHPRTVIRRTLKYTIVQIIDSELAGDKVLEGNSSKVLRKYGWDLSCSNISASYLLGYYIGKRGVKKGIDQAVLDSGLYKPTPGGRIYAAVKGLKDSGIEIPCDEECLPPEDTITGKKLGEERAKLFDKVKNAIDKGKEKEA